MTNVVHALQMAKLNVAGFTPDWKKEIFICAVYGFPDLNPPDEIVTIAEVKDAVCDNDGKVDVSVLHSCDGKTEFFDNWITFTDYLHYEFEKEATQVLEGIINKRRAKI